jgi:membrane-associated phospholipid phosphatase
MRARIALALAAAALGVGALAATYAVAFATDAGRRADARIFIRIGFANDSELRKLGHRIGGDKLNVIAAAGVVLGAALLVILSSLEKARLRGVYVILLVGCAFATTELLKPPLGDWGQRLAPDRVATNAFPSGHATLAMAIVLAAVMALPLRRGVITLCAAALATLLGVLIVVGGLHPPSDVVGGYLVAGIWAALMTPLVRPLEGRAFVGRREHRALSGIGLGALALVGLVFAAVIAVYVEQVLGIHRTLLFLVSGLALESVLIVAIIGVLCDLADRSE